MKGTAGRILAGTAALVLGTLALSGCGWKKEVDKLRSDNQKLTQDKQRLEGQLTTVGVESTEMQKTLDEVQQSLEQLRVKELQVIRTSIEVAQEGKPASSRREQLQAEISSLKNAVRENLDKLAKLEKDKKAAEAKAATLGKKSEELEARVTTLGRLVQELRRSLEEKETLIAELESKVLNLSKTVETQAVSIQEKEGVIETQVKEINKAYVAIGNKRALREKGLIEKKGSVLGLGGSWLRTGKFDPEIFREIDLRKETEFAIGAPVKKIRVLSDHPRDSYEIVAAGEAGCALKVLDGPLFWKGSKYLVVMLPD